MSRNPSTTLVSILSKMDIQSRFEYYAANNGRRTSSKNVFLKEYGCYVSRPMTAGNSKLDKSMLIFDQLAIDSCPNCAACRITCYALKAQRQYADVLLKRTVNTYLGQHNLPLLQSIIMQQLARTKKRVVRIHSSGDFNSQEYVNLWTTVAEAFPRVRFYTYTKTDNLFDFSRFMALDNTNIVHSLLPDGSLNYGPYEEMLLKAKALRAPICAYRKGMDADSMPHCGLNCTACITRPYVLFVQH